MLRALGASVVLTDHQTAIHVTEKSVKLNVPSNAELKLDVVVRSHNWGSDVQDFNPPVDFVLGADIVYLEGTFPALLETLQSLTQCGLSTVVLALTIRYRRDVAF